MGLVASLAAGLQSRRMFALLELQPVSDLGELAQSLGLTLTLEQLRGAQDLVGGLPYQRALWMLERVGQLPSGRARLLGLGWAAGTVMGGHAAERVRVLQGLAVGSRWLGLFRGLESQWIDGEHGTLEESVGESGLALAQRMVPALSLAVSNSQALEGLSCAPPQSWYSALASYLLGELALRQVLDGRAFLALSSGPKAAKVGSSGMPVGPPLRTQDGLFGAVPAPRKAPLDLVVKVAAPPPSAPLPSAPPPAVPPPVPPQPGPAAFSAREQPPVPLHQAFEPDSVRGSPQGSASAPSGPPTMTGAPQGPGAPLRAGGTGKWVAVVIFVLVLALVLLLVGNVMLGLVAL